MKIVHIIATFGMRQGGTTSATYNLVLALQSVGANAEIMTSKSLRPGDQLAGNGEFWIKAVEDDLRLRPFDYSSNIKKALLDSNYDIYHANGMWQHCIHIAAKVSRQRHKIFVLTPHGMLYTDPYPDFTFKKKLFLKFLFNKDILKADCLHATCEQEMMVLRNFGYKGPIAVIPNLVHIPKEAHVASVEDKQNFKVGYLGRIDRRKHIENILYATSLLPQKSGITIVVMGKGDDEYEEFLKKEARRLNLNVDFKGFVTGIDKYNILRSLSLLVVPSGFENFGMIIAEALTCGTPVMASLGTPWEDLNTYKCGWWAEKSPESIANIIKMVWDMPKEELLEMGKRGRLLVEEKYSPHLVATKMAELYKWLMGEVNKPDFVHFMSDK